MSLYQQAKNLVASHVAEIQQCKQCTLLVPCEYHLEQRETIVNELKSGVMDSINKEENKEETQEE